ncbi:outer membrane protein [Azospirillaceae bacterium]
MNKSNLFRFIRLSVGAVCVCAVLFGGLPVRADDLKPPTVAIVNIPWVVQNAEATKSIQRAVEAQRQPWAKEIADREEKLRSEEQELNRQRNVLSSDALTSKRRDFETKVADFQKNVQGKMRALDQAGSEAMNTVSSNLQQIVAEVAQEVGASLVLQAQAVAFADQSTDVSKTVLERLNNKLPQVSVKLPKK